MRINVTLDIDVYHYGHPGWVVEEGDTPKDVIERLISAADAYGVITVVDARSLP